MYNIVISKIINSGKSIKIGEYKKGIGYFHSIKLKSQTGNKIKEDYDILWLRKLNNNIIDS